MIRLLFFIFLFINTTLCYSQSISVSSFKLLDSDLTANTAGTMEHDQNGEVAALIKVVTTQTGFTFDCGAMGIVKTLQKPSEIWVYVPRGVKKMTISHPQLGLLRDYFFPLPIDAARTYEMVLTTGTIQTIVQHTNNSQYLVLKVNPSNAVVELNNEILSTDQGVAQKFVKLGTYDYRAQAPNYHTAAGKVSVDDPNNKKVVEINLQPAFGWIEISGKEEYNGAQVFIDNALAGTIPMKSSNLASGEHSVKIVKSLYSPFSQTIVVKDNETTQITPNLKADFSEVTISVDNDADIYVNEEKKGTGTWTGRLSSGNYVLQAKKEGYRGTTKNIDISSNIDKQSILLLAPSPIYGEVNITSSPSMADVYIDGKQYGETPLYLPKLLIGKYQLVLKKDGYADYVSSFEIKENQSYPISAKLLNQVEATIKTTPSTAEIFIDGVLERRGYLRKLLPIGNHVIEVKDDEKKFLSYKKDINISSTNNVFNIVLEEKDTKVYFTYETPKPSRKAPIYISIDGEEYSLWEENTITGSNEISRILSVGVHTIKIRHKGIKEIIQNIDVNHSHNSFRLFFKKRSFVTIKNANRYSIF